MQTSNSFLRRQHYVSSVFKQILKDLEVALVAGIVHWCEVFILSSVNYILSVKVVSYIFNQMLHSGKVVHQHCYVDW